jgi:hypothetical protein
MMKNAGELIDHNGAEEELAREAQYMGAADAAGTLAMEHASEPERDYDFYKDIYSDMDWTPEDL